MVEDRTSAMEAFSKFLTGMTTRQNQRREAFDTMVPRPGEGLKTWLLQARVHGASHSGRFFGFHVLSDLSIGMAARRKAWPPNWLLHFGADDTLVLWEDHTVSRPWIPTQEDLLITDWITGD